MRELAGKSGARPVVEMTFRSLQPRERKSPTIWLVPPNAERFLRGTLKVIGVFEDVPRDISGTVVWLNHAVVLHLSFSQGVARHVSALPAASPERVMMWCAARSSQARRVVVVSRVRLCGRTIESVLKESLRHGKTPIRSC